MMKNKVRQIRELRGLSQDAVAARMGTNRGQVSKLESGKARLNDVWIERLSKALRCQPAELIGDLIQREVPIIGDVPGGNLMEAIHNTHDGFVLFNSQKPNLYAVRVRGNSMSRIAPDGSYVIVDMDDKNPDSLVNQPIIVCFENDGAHECSFKIYKRNPVRFEPFSIEAGYDTIFPNNRPWVVYGRVIGVVGYLSNDHNDARLISCSKG